MEREERSLPTHMHIHRINTKLISTKPKTLKDLIERKLLAVSEADDLVWGMLHFGFDEAEEMLLVHGGGVVDVGVDLV